MLPRDIRRLVIIGDALRVNTPEPSLMLDVNESWNLKQAVRYVSKVEEVHDLAWIEEPIRRWDAEGHARLSASVTAAVATGENLTGLEQYRPLFNAGGIDIVQAAATWGVTHFLRVAIAAHSRDLPVSPVGLTANAAVAQLPRPCRITCPPRCKTSVRRSASRSTRIMPTAGSCSATARGRGGCRRGGHRHARARRTGVASRGRPTCQARPRGLQLSGEPESAAPAVVPRPRDRRIPLQGSGC